MFVSSRLAMAAEVGGRVLAWLDSAFWVHGLLQHQTCSCSILAVPSRRRRRILTLGDFCLPVAVFLLSALWQEIRLGPWLYHYPLPKPLRIL